MCERKEPARMVAVKSKLCCLCTHVAEELEARGKATHQLSHDCFCGENEMASRSFSFEMSDEVLEFIRDAVNEKLGIKTRSS